MYSVIACCCRRAALAPQRAVVAAGGLRRTWYAKAEMTHVSRYDRARARLLAGWQNRALGFKAIAFGLVGVVNTAVDYGVFLLARARA